MKDRLVFVVVLLFIAGFTWFTLTFVDNHDKWEKCVVDSFRKQEIQKNHNRHFSEWLAESDKDYSKAQELYDKLAKRDGYMRSI